MGGSSGVEGDDEVERIERLIEARGLGDRVTMIPPRPHHVLSTYYRAADVCLVPSRSESFGLVALEAAACGTPVVAADVGGLRTLVDHGRTGFRVTGRDPAAYAEATRSILDSPLLADELSRHGAEVAATYTWTTMAARLRRVYADIAAQAPLDCLA
ncbi:MAG: glycosyltransferase family 1 protein [Actinobacteria bacterium]|nr:glycosyltransferase family 1 protein [Actinomycetota bacterium]NIS34773.1 glycosyltransferase family 1 protein [Actinomycetota bacterium]NIT97752.1 glycosyltransferase family 1 protein [Actinomycetota bacterium]NIU21388.1 glycosyltransferase family 1 protein [Actinomycetota bacterium]NIU69524.1 glycosyltransferase family 1 protein [Actinomycetota bacterium]